MSFVYRTETKDLRAAMYYSVLMRNVFFCRIVLILLPLALLYFFGVTCGLWPDIPAISYVVLAFGIWILVLLGNAELQILKLSRSKDSLLGVETGVKMQDNWLFVDIADRDFHFKGKLSELAGVVELKRVFLLYVNAQQTFVIPRRAIPDEAGFMRCLEHVPEERFIRENDGKSARSGGVFQFLKGRKQ